MSTVYYVRGEDFVVAYTGPFSSREEAVKHKELGDSIFDYGKNGPLLRVVTEEEMYEQAGKHPTHPKPFIMSVEADLNDWRS